MAADTVPMTTRPCCDGIASSPVIRTVETVGTMRQWKVFPFTEIRAGVPDTLRQLPEAKTDLFDTITAVATRCWAVSVRWSMSGEIRAVALNYLSTGSGTDHNLQSAPLSGIIHSTHKREFAWIMSSVFFTRA